MSKIAELPVTMSGAQALVSAKLNGEDVVFMVDSQAFHSVISAGTASMLHLPLSPMPNGYEVQIGSQEVDNVATAKKFSISNLKLSEVKFIVSKSEIDVNIGGRLGLNVLGAVDTEYDFGNSAIRLLSTKNCDGVDLAYWEKGKPYAMAQSRPGDPLHPEPIVIASINGVEVRVSLNSAIPNSVLALRAARRADFNISVSNPKPYKNTEQTDKALASIKEFGIGEEKIRNVKLPIGRVNDDVDMALGMDFFLSHHILVAKSQNRVYVSYEGGPVFASPQLVAQGSSQSAKPMDRLGASANLQDVRSLTADDRAAAADGLAVIDAEGLSRRGAFLASRHEYDKAIADLSKASELAPDNADYEYQLAAALIAEHQEAPGVADLDKAIKLNPDNAKPLLMRALIRHADKDQAGELADLATLSHMLPANSYMRLTLADLYLAADRNDAAVVEYDDWIGSYPDDSHRPQALNGRCWARALAGRELDKALSDCNRAVLRMPTASFFDSRGLVRLRRGEFGRAIDDYNRALKRNPNIAWSLYGRGLAELKIGDADKGRNDIAAAAAIDAKLPERAAKLGLSPDAFVAAAGSAVASSTH